MTQTLGRLTRWLLILFPFSNIFAQHADLGSGALKNQIWWINWAGTTVTNGATKTFTTDDGLTVTLTFSNVSARAPLPSVMNTWPGAVLHLLYDFSNPSVLPALFDNNTRGVSKFTMTISATRNSASVPFYVVAADAEGSLPRRPGSVVRHIIHGNLQLVTGTRA